MSIKRTNNIMKTKNSNNNETKPIAYDALLCGVSFQFIYRTEEQIKEAEEENGKSFPDCMESVFHKEYISKKPTLREAIDDFLEQELGTLFDVDEEVRVEFKDGSERDIYVGLVQDWDGSFYYNAT